MQTLSLSAFALTLAAPLLAQEPISDAAREARERAFEEQLSGCRMVGRFTVSGSDEPAREEAYTISRVSWVTQNKWRFDATIEYMDRKVTVPVVVEVEWAGDTPMIQVTDKAIPGLGTYSARVLIYRDQYAGWWGGKDHGGHMFGRIEPLEGDGEGEGDGKARAGGQDDAKGQGSAPDAGSGGQDPAPASAAEPTPWGQWRGPGGLALVEDATPPLEWSEDRNIAWKRAVPGLGLSTPVVAGDRLFLTTAIDTGRAAEGDPVGSDDARPEPEPEPDARGGRRGRRGRGGPAAPRTLFDFRVVALDRHSGEEIWSRTVCEAVPHEAGHADSTQASGSPITDGKHVWASFGSRGIYCLTVDGQPVWKVDLGRMQTRNAFGEGSSPALGQGRLVVVWDHEGDSFIVALDAATGEELWRQPRDEPTTWATPQIVEVDGRHQVIASGTTASRGYDLETGEVAWSCTGLTLNAIPSPLHRDGVVYLMSGFRGNMVQAIRLSGARGDLDGTEHVLWQHGRNAPYVPSGLLYGDSLYFLRTNSGVLSCLDPATGVPHYEGERLGLRSVYSSPVGAAGRVYITSRAGETVVLAAGPRYEVLATNQLEDGIDATLVIVDDTIYARGRESLYCIRAPR